MAGITLKQGDTQIPLLVTLQTATGGGVPLAGATVTMLLGRDGGEAVEHAVTVTGAETGQVRVDFAAEDLAKAGDYQAEFKVVFADGTQASIPTRGYIPIKVLPSLSTL